MRTTAVLVCCLVVLSGCSGLTGGGEYPPGTNETHVNETALVIGHQSALDNRSYTVVSRVNVSLERTPENVTLPPRQGRTEVRIGTGGTPYHSIETRGNRTSELFIANGTVYRRVETPHDVAYRVLRPGARGPVNETLGAPNGLELLVAPPDPNYTFVRREGGFLGERLYVFRAESTGFPGETGDGSETNFTATLRVTGDGAIRSYEDSIALGEGSTNRTFRVTDIGSTAVPEPEWLEAARANATTR
jgi:hypothetical protein